MTTLTMRDEKRLDAIQRVYRSDLTAKVRSGCRGEGWVLVPQFSAISPLTFDKRWSKNRIIELFNASANAKRAGFQYPYRSLGSRPIQVVVRDVADLLNHSERVAPQTARGKTRASGVS